MRLLTSGDLRGKRGRLIGASDRRNGEIYDEESGELASEVVTKAVLSEKIRLADKPLILHADNGSPMKSATLRATMEKLGVLFSHSRPRVSNDNPYSESIR